MFKKIRPGNFIFYLCAICAPWHIWNTYIETDGLQIIFSRYFCANDFMRKRTDKINISEVVTIGFPNELGISMQEEIAHGRYGTYCSQEIDFLLKSGNIIPLNARPYTKRQCRRLVSLFLCKKEQRLINTLGL